MNSPSDFSPLSAEQRETWKTALLPQLGIEDRPVDKSDLIMKFWIDCEWNGSSGELISMALVSQDFDKFYFELELPENVEAWVADNVVPHLMGHPIGLANARSNLIKFLSKYKQAHIIADWPEDLVHFNKLLITGPGTAITGYLPPLSFELHPCNGACRSTIPHNALYDAMANAINYKNSGG